MLWVGPGSLMWRGKARPAGTPVPAGMTPERIAEFVVLKQIEDDPKAKKPVEIKTKHQKRGKK